MLSVMILDGACGGAAPGWQPVSSPPTKRPSDKSVRNSHAVERPGSHCGIVLPWTTGAGGLLSPFAAGRLDLSAVVCSSRLSRLRRARFGFCGGLYGLAQNINLHDHRAWRGNGADSVFAAVGNAVIVRADRAVSDLRPDSDGDWRGDLSPMRLGFRLDGQRDSRAD